MKDITLTIDGNDWNTLKNGGIVVKVVNYEFNSTFLTNYKNNYNFGATKQEDGHIFYYMRHKIKITARYLLHSKINRGKMMIKL